MIGSISIVCCAAPKALWVSLLRPNSTSCRSRSIPSWSAGLKLSAEQLDCPLFELAGVPLVTPGGGVGLRLLIERTFAREDVALNIIADIDSLPTMIEIACRGTACTILPPSSLMTKARDSWPLVRKISKPGISRPASLCWPTSLPTTAANLAIRHLIPSLVTQLQTSGEWIGITLREAP
ncbi:LysR substrate-binding domain-containing protein [Pseudomonas sp. Leaf48]|uniref:LysR substrate-binding domain-containing protein n=1 Tax=Pseudomonas sp. Leaf48 TaxID=1736221 RepID=UPI003FA797E1